MLQKDKLLVEFVQYVAPDGTEYPLFGGRRTLMGWRGVGSPEITYISDKAPFQHGVTVRDWRYQPRTIQFEMYEHGRKREDFYRFHGGMINAVRPNRSASSAAAGKIQIVLKDGSFREIGARIQTGPQGEWVGTGEQSSYDLRERPSFFCEDPFWRDVDSTDVTFVVSLADSCLDTCLPFCLGSTLISTTVDVPYTGTWYGDQITITLTGPMDAPQISNLTAGASIGLNYSIASGEEVTISISPQLVTVENNSGVNLIGAVSQLSDLVDFRFVPASDLTPTGINEIQVIASGGVVNRTAIGINYYTRHITVFGSEGANT